jgi:hypothetical protein
VSATRPTPLAACFMDETDRCVGNPLPAAVLHRGALRMSNTPFSRRLFLGTAAAAGVGLAHSLRADEGLKEPVFRVSKNEPNVPAGAAATDKHPLDPALALAEETLAFIRAEVNDYTATIVKRERIKGVLGQYEYMAAKIRNRKEKDGQITQPLSVYLYFLKPDNIKGREVIWVEGKNNNKMRAHEGGLLGRTLPSVWLDPHGALAMRGQLHPITEIGIENLVTKLIEKGQHDRQYGECEVEFKPGAKINGMACTLLEVRHPVQRDYFEFYKAQIFIDDKTKVPLRYAAYHWPTDPSDKMGPVIEEYTYLDLKLNVGLADADFDPDNPNYGY